MTQELLENIGLKRSTLISPLFVEVEPITYFHLFKEGETEEQVYKTMMTKVEEVEKRKSHEEIMKNNWYYLEALGNWIFAF